MYWHGLVVLRIMDVAYAVCIHDFSKLNVVDTFRCSLDSVTHIPEQEVTLTDTVPADVISLFHDDTDPIYPICLQSHDAKLHPGHSIPSFTLCIVRRLSQLHSNCK